MTHQQTRPGVLPRQMILESIRGGFVSVPDQRYANPASLDLPLSDEVYRLARGFIPQPGERVRDLIASVGGGRRMSFETPLEVGVSYLAKIDGTFALPPNVYGYINPKSTTGRNNVFVRGIADSVDLHDALQPKGWSGELWVSIRPDSYPVLLRPGIPLNQLRLFDAYTVLNRTEMELAIASHKLLWSSDGEPYGVADVRFDGDGSIFLTLDFSSEMVGWECRNPSTVLDFSQRGHEKEEFFDPVYARNGGADFRKDRFYILSTGPCVSVPAEFSAELRPIDPRLGEFRSHAAGYIDPGWGWRRDGSHRGRQLTLELIPYEDITIRSGQIVAKLRYERMIASPDVLYEDGAQSNYADQVGPRLAKQFV